MKQAKDKDENGDGGKTENVDGNAVLAQILQQLVANQPAKVITEGSPEYRAMMEEQGFFDYFSKPVFQNGKEAEPRGLSAQTRERASNLRAGKYLGGKVAVEVSNNGSVHLKYKSARIEDRMAQPFGDFTDLIDKIWSEMSQPVSA